MADDQKTNLSIAKPTTPKSSPVAKKPVSDQDIQIREKFAALRKQEISGLRFLPEGANEDERARYELCQDICRVFNERKMSIQALSVAIGYPVPKTNQIIHSHYQNFTVQELSDGLERLIKLIEL